MFRKAIPITIRKLYQSKTIAIGTSVLSTSYLFFKSQPIAEAAPSTMELKFNFTFSWWSSEKSNPRFNLKEKIPQAKDAKQIFEENPEMTFIGVYNIKTKEVILMPAMKEYLTINYGTNGEIISGKEFYNYRFLSKDEIINLNKEYKFFIPRSSDQPTFRTSHEIVLAQLGIEDTNDFYGFSVTSKKEGPPQFCWISGSLNNKPGNYNDRYMPKKIQAEVETVFASWSQAKNISDSLSPILTRTP